MQPGNQTPYGQVGQPPLSGGDPGFVGPQQGTQMYYAPPAQQVMSQPVAYYQPQVEASYTPAPLSSRKKIMIIGGFLLCFILGVGAGFALTFLKNGVTSGVTNQASALRAPIDLRSSTMESNTALFISWGAVKGASSYTLTYAKDELFTKEVKKVEDIKENTFILRGLVENETYYLQVTAYDGVNQSVPSGISSASLVD